jgi:flagellar hook assembly protein FlgD
VVAENGKTAIEHVLNYPNPFTTNTNFTFEHNLAGEPMRVRVQIFTVAGKLVKTILADLTPDGFRVANLPWDGRDEYGDPLARGVYVYKINLETTAGSQKRKAESEFQRLVILK